MPKIFKLWNFIFAVNSVLGKSYVFCGRIFKITLIPVQKHQELNYF